MPLKGGGVLGDEKKPYKFIYSNSILVCGGGLVFFKENFLDVWTEINCVLLLFKNAIFFYFFLLSKIHEIIEN